jgi:Na+-translocating ferredoxin:NAD+ oxidoreductase RnfG subunit
MEKNWLLCMTLPLAAVVTPAYAADYLSAQEAQKILFPEAQEFVRLPIRLNDDQISEIRRLSSVRQREDEPEIWEAKVDGRTTGWFFVDNVVGKHEFITYAAALSPEGEVIGIEVMSYRETYGGEIRDAEWRAFFEGKSLDDEFRLNRDVPNISGATLSCRNVTDGVKRLLALQQVVLLR